MYAPELARILSGLPHDAVVQVQGLNPVTRYTVSHIEIRGTGATLTAVIVVYGKMEASR